MAEKIKCDCGNTFEVEKEQTHCKYCGIKLSDIGKEKLVGLEEEDKTTLSESQKKKIEEEEEYRLSVKKDLGKKKKGKGCLMAIGFLIGFFIFIAATGGSGEKGKPTSEAEKQKTQLEAEKALDGYMDFINASGMNKYVSSVKVGGPGGENVEVVVKNIWHYQPKQIRLQAAQTLWETWATSFCPEKENPDSCRLTLKDLTDNTVGGSSALAGSIINVID